MRIHKNYWYRDPVLKNRNLWAIAVPIQTPICVPFDVSQLAATCNTSGTIADDELCDDA